jgi:hypothetical protein
VPGSALLVVHDRSGEGPRFVTIEVDWEPAGRVELDWPYLPPAELLRALESAKWNKSPHAIQHRVARALRDREERKRERRDALHDPEYRANVHATALAVAFALLGLAFALQALAFPS